MNSLINHCKLLAYFFRRTIGLYDLAAFFVLVGVDLIIRSYFSLTWPLPHMIISASVLVNLAHAWACSDCVKKMSQEDKDFLLKWLSR